jgi:RNA polymerase sigma factor (sigma-70 family)
VANNSPPGGPGRLFSPLKEHSPGLLVDSVHMFIIWILAFIPTVPDAGVPMRSNSPRRPTRPRPFQLLEGRADRRPPTRPLDAAGRERVAQYVALAYQQAWKVARIARDIPADELTAEALYGLTYASSLYDPERRVPFGAYATMVIRHRLTLMVAVWRRARRTVGRLPGADREDAWEAEDRPGLDVSTATATHELCDRVRELLPPRWYMFLRLHHGEGRTLEEIGTRYGVTRQRVRELVVKATQKVREHFPEWMGN